MSALCAPLAAEAVNLSVNITVDNSYALFYGTATQATTFVGTDSSWGPSENYTFSLPDTAYLYVVTQSDLNVAQGFLGQFVNTDTHYKFYSQDAAWQVMATGLGNTGAPYSGSDANLSLLSTQIVLANGGGTASNGWVATTAGAANGASPWGPISGIDAAAHWVWYQSGNCPQYPDPTIGGCNHDEWLVFRIAAAATPENPVPSIGVPEPATLSLFGLGMAGLGLARRRKPRG